MDEGGVGREVGFVHCELIGKNNIKRLLLFFLSGVIYEI
jgi:hypothetical protein